MHKHHGFTIVELLIVITVIALLATISGLAWRTTRNNAIDAKNETNLRIITNAIERYYRDNGQYPAPSGCYSSGCNNGELASILLPKYLKELPKDHNENHYGYISATSPDSYAVRVEKADGTICKAGKAMKTTWYASAPNCNL